MPPAWLTRLSLTTRFALVNLVVVTGLGLGIVGAVGHVVNDEATAEAKRNGALAASFLHQTLPADAGGRPLSAVERRRLDVVVEGVPSLHSLRLWDLDGRVRYDSRDPQLAGQRLPVGPLLASAYAGRTRAHVERDNEARASADAGHLLEVYVPLRSAADGRVAGALELYLDHAPAVVRAREANRLIAVAVAVGLGALWGMLWWLSLRVTRGLRRRASEESGLARTDELTGLANRRALLSALDAAVSAQTPAALLLLDLDRFKEVNDTLGHHVGDQLLRLVGARLAGAVRGTGTVARLGGDEFAVLLPDRVDRDDVRAVSDRLVAALEEPFALEDLQVGIGTSIGVALSPGDARTPAELLQRADVAMYVAKERGGGTAVYDPSQDLYSADRLELLSELRSGLASGELWLAYQPIWDLQTHGACVGVEALLRWDNPRQGPVSPADFVPLCEHSSVVRELTRFVLDESLRQLRQWQEEGTVLNLAVNLSASNLGQQDLPEVVACLLAEHGVPADRVVLEITESAVIPDPERAAAVLHRLVELGLDVALDDFGTGWSSMSRLLELPLAALKVDRSFVADLPDAQGAAVVRATTGLGHELGLFVVAEGIETVEQLECVVRTGCDIGQGYLLSRPLPPSEVPAAAVRTVHEWLVDGRVPAPRS